MFRSQLLVVFLCCLPLAACLRCYTCVFPALSSMDCLKFPQECPAGQRCLSSTAVGTRGAMQLTLYEKSCAIPAQCGINGTKQAAGLSFDYSNICCDTDLCNGGGSAIAPSWRAAVVCLLPVLYLLLV